MTYDTRIGAVEAFSFTPDSPVKTTQKVGSSFDSVFDAAMDVIRETNEYQLIASKEQQDLATGRTDDVLTVMLAQDRAFSSLNFTVQVTNKIIESYREIMRMQI